MVRRPRSVIFPALALALLGAGRVPADDDVLKIVPADALGCVIFHRPGETEALAYKAAVQFDVAAPRFTTRT